MGKSGKWTFQPMTTLYEDYPYSVNVTAKTKNIIIVWKHRYIRMFPHFYPRLIVVAFLQNVDTSLYIDVSAF